MRLVRCKIEEFMGVKELDMPLDSNVVVLLGDNGSGKTSLVRALRVGIGAWLHGIPEQGVSAPSIEKWTMRHVLRKEGYEVVRYPARHPTKVTLTASGLADEPIEWSVVRAASKSSRTTWSGASDLRSLSKAWSQTEGQVLPLVAYFGARRGRRKSSRKRPKGPEPRTHAYRRCLDSTVDVNRLVARWDRLDRQARRSEEASSVLAALESCIARLVPDDVEVHYDPSLEEPVVFPVGESPHNPVGFTALSDGFRSVIEIGMDVALRAVQLNPAMGAKAITDTPGVVVVDEIGQHLHPSWQMEVLSQLANAFPAIQFILTTHSPFVALHAPRDALYYRLQLGPEGPVASKLAPVQTLDEALHGRAFGPLLTIGPELLEALNLRQKLLLEVDGAPTGQQREALEQSARRIAELRGRPPTGPEDRIRRAAAELDDEEGAPELDESLAQERIARLKAAAKARGKSGRK